MFSLLVTVLSIALVALLALATLYYVSDIFSDRSLKAKAATVRLQGQQISAALDMYRANNGSWPQKLQDLVDGDYLKYLPQPPGAISVAPSVLDLVLPPAVAGLLNWEMPREGRPHFWVLEGVGQVACQVLNSYGRQSTSILEKADARHLDQCFGRAAPFTYLWTLDGSTLGADIPWDDTVGGGASYGGPGFGRPIAFPSPVLIPGEPNPIVVGPNPPVGGPPPAYNVPFLVNNPTNVPVTFSIVPGFPSYANVPGGAAVWRQYSINIAQSWEMVSHGMTWTNAQLAAKLAGPLAAGQGIGTLAAATLPGLQWTGGQWQKAEATKIWWGWGLGVCYGPSAACTQAQVIAEYQAMIAQWQAGGAIVWYELTPGMEFQYGTPGMDYWAYKWTDYSGSDYRCVPQGDPYWCTTNNRHYSVTAYEVGGSTWVAADTNDLVAALTTDLATQGDQATRLAALVALQGEGVLTSGGTPSLMGPASIGPYTLSYNGTTLTIGGGP